MTLLYPENDKLFQPKFRRGWTFSFLPYKPTCILYMDNIKRTYVPIRVVCRTGVNSNQVFFGISLNEDGRLICNSTMSQRILEMI